MRRVRGVIAASAGNHAQGVAYHAQRLGVPSVIVMPRFTPGVKIERTREFGAEVILHGEVFDDARAHARRALAIEIQFEGDARLLRLFIQQLFIDVNGPAFDLPRRVRGGQRFLFRRIRDADEEQNKQ